MLEALDDKLDTLTINSHKYPILTSLDNNNTTKRHKLTDVISELVCQWSDGFLELAQSGDTQSMILVAQMYLNTPGYGNIKYNHIRGIQWLQYAIQCGDMDARELLKRYDAVEYEKLLQKELGRKVTENDLATDQQRIQANRDELENIRNDKIG